MADDLVLPSPDGEDNPADTPRFWAPPDAPTSGAPTRSVGGAMGPAVPQPYDGGSFSGSARGFWGDSIAGSLSNAGRDAYLRGEDPSAGELPPPSADEKARMQDSLFEQLGREISPTSQGPQNLAGAIVGSMGSPEAWGGISSLLVRKLPMLASRPALTGSIDNLITNSLGNIVAQGINLASGEQEHFEPVTAATAAAVGAVVGGAVGHVTGGHAPKLSHETPTGEPESMTLTVTPSREAGAPEAQPPKAPETPAGGQGDSAAATVAPEAPAPASAPEKLTPEVIEPTATEKFKDYAARVGADEGTPEYDRAWKVWNDVAIREYEAKQNGQQTQATTEAGPGADQSGPVVAPAVDQAAQAPAARTSAPSVRVEPGLRETRGEGVQYHGTSNPDLVVDEGHYSTKNYYGQGFYTTDAADIAHGYARRGSEQTGRHLYEIKENGPLNIYDAEQPIGDDLKKLLTDDHGFRSEADDLIEEALGEKPANLRELYDNLREIGTDSFAMPADQIQEVFDSVNWALRELGYKGLSHTGGLKTANAPHRVVIYFDPHTDIQVQRRSFDDFKATAEPRPGELANTEPPVHEKDIVNPLDRNATPEEKVAHLQALTAENEPIVADLIKSIDDEFGTTSKANKKAPENILTKAQRPSILERKPWFDVEHIRDSYRFKTILEDVRDLPNIVARLDERGIEIIKRDTDKVLEPQEWGWRIAAFDLRMKNGQLVEYYLPVRELEEAKKAGHVIFEKWRNLRQGDLTAEQLAEKAADLQASRDLYQSAWDAYLARSGATESEVRAALSKAATSPASSTGLNSSLRSPTVTPGSLRQLPSTISAENLSAASDTNAVLNGSSRPLHALTNENVTGTSGSNVGSGALAGNGDTQAAALLGKQVEKIAPHQVTDASGRTIDVAPIVVEARDLRTSADEGFDASLQPRNRDRAASQAQIRDIAGKLDPQRLGYSAEADRGAPIIGADGSVESGNGRVMALRAVYEENGPAAERYRKWLAEQGVDVSAYDQPVLVRQRLTELAPSERQAFTLAANESSTLALSASERAMADARLLPVETLDLIRNADDLGAAANRDFVKAFVAKLPQTEQGAVVDAHGAISSNGLTRIRNAVLARAYGDSAIIARVAEATSDEIKSISNALVSAAPEWAKLRAEISTGLVRADVDMTDELLEAVKRTADLRSKGTKLSEHLAQQDAFDRLPEPVEAWMKMFYDPSGKRAAGAPKIAERLRFYAEEARKASNDVGLDFGLAPIEARDIQALAAQKGQPNGTQTEGQGVFLRRRPSNGPGDEAGRGHGPAAGSGEPGRGAGEPGGALGDAGLPGSAGAGADPHGVTIKDRGDGSFHVNAADGAGDLALHVTPDAVRTSVASVSKGRRGEGIAVAMYERAVAFAAERGLPLRSDVSVSTDARRVYEALKRRGYDVREAPNVNKFERGWTTDDFTNKGWVFEVRPPAEPELNLRVKRQTVPNQIVAGRAVEDQGTTGGRVQRLEDLARGIVEAIHVTAREGRVTPGALGQFSQRTGNVRVRSIRDLDTVLHEAGHALHLDPENKAKIDPLLKAFADELEPLGAKDGPKGRAEAFAELFRLYAVNRAYAAREFPNATAALEANLKQHFPEQAKALDALRANLDAIHNAPSGELVTADTINVPPPGRIDKLKEFVKADVDPSGRTVYSWMDAAYTSAIDKLHPIYRAVGALTRIAKENGKKVDLLPADDAYLLARNSPGAHGGATVMLKHGVIPAGGYQPAGPSMADAIEKAIGRKWKEADFNDFGAYLVARRMVQEYARYFRGEIPNPPGKFSVADYKSAVASFEGKYPSFAEAAQDLYAFQTNYLQRMFDKGLVSKAYFDAAMSRADYVPFVRDMADFADNAATLPKAGGGAGGIMRSSVMKKFGGSDRAVVNPLESIFKKVHDLEFTIARNDIVNALDRLAADAGPGSGFIAERVPSNQLVGQKADVIDALKSAGKTAGIDKADLEALILQAEDVLGDSTMATLFRNQPIMSEGGEPIIYGWRGGERYALRLGDGRFGRELYRSMTVMHDVERNVFFMALQISQMALRNGVVKAPDFILSNIIRDQQTALVAGGRKYIPFVSALRGLGDIITGSDVAKAYAGSGGMSAGAITEAIEHSGFGKNVHALNHRGILSTLGKVFEASEAGTRIGLYRSYFKQALDMGFDEYNAHLYGVFKSQDYIDFRRGGADMDRLRRWVPFLNAAVQGTDREVRALADLPVLEAKRIRGDELSTIEQDRLKDARVALVRTMAFGAVLGSGVAIMNHDDPDYQSAAKYTRNTNWLIKVGSNTWAAIPKPYGIVQAIANAFERASEYAFRKDPALFQEWAAASAESMLPPSQNPLVSVLYDVPANYDRFRERAIVPDYLQKVAPAEQYRPDTSEFAKALGQLTNWSPLKIEYAMRNLGASGALDLLKVGDLLMGRERPEKQIYDWPILRRFMKNLERGNAATTAFYGLVGDKAGTLEQAKLAYQTKIRGGERLEAEKYLNGLPDDEKVWTVMSTFADAKEKRLHPLVNARDQVSVGTGLLGQLNSNNVVREDDLDRQDLTSSRRAAKPLQLTSSSRSQAIEDLQELNMIAARNAMVTVGAKGTLGLPVLDPGPALERLKMHAPEVADEYQARLEIHHVYDPATVREAWPEMKQRFLRDGENADVHDLAPRQRKHRKQRRDLDATE